MHRQPVRDDVMRKKILQGTTACCLAALVGCAGQPIAAPAPVAKVAPPQGRAYTLDTPLHIIAADPRANAILWHDLPGLMGSNSYMMIDDMSLAQIASVSGGRLTTAKLNLVQSDLAGLAPDP
jgi:hypothetical protein